MIKRNVWKEVNEPLESFEDYRGKITDIFYKNNIDHVAIIHSEPNIMRGNHYHKQSTQHMLITKGSLEYWHKPLGSDCEPVMVLAEVGDLVTTPPNELHALVIRDDGNEFIVFSEGVRGGCDYESDTFRVECFVPSDKVPTQK
jgi:dTDP-4-dehydrorhamnose 3,5-epimerase-like enzyme